MPSDSVDSNVSDTEADEVEEPSAASATSSSRGTATSLAGATLAFEMDAAVWTAIAIVAGMSFGTLVYLGSRIGVLATRLDARIDSGFARVDTRFDAIEARFDGLATRLDAHLEQHAG